MFGMQFGDGEEPLPQATNLQQKKAHIMTQTPSGATPPFAPPQGGAHIQQPGFTSAPTETEDERIERLINDRLSKVLGQPVQVSTGPQPGMYGPDPDDFDPDDPDEVNAMLDAVLEALDPTDSEQSLKLFHWLQENARLHKVATLEQGGYMFLYQEPKGSSREGWTAGGTQGDRIVDSALEKAQESGAVRTEKGLCRKCFSPVTRSSPSATPEAESPKPGTSPKECPKGGNHDFVG